MTTDITVRGQAHDVRDPDRAVLSVHVSAEARDWAEAHIAVSAALATLNASITALQTAKPNALERFSVEQSYQSSWETKGGQWFRETVAVTLRFTDFAAMSEWAFGNTNPLVQMGHVSWELSPQVQDTVRRELGQAAVRDARDRADNFAAAAGLKIVAVQALADPGLLVGAPANGSSFGAASYAASPAMFTRAMDGASGAQVIDLTPDVIETTASVEAHFLAE